MPAITTGLSLRLPSFISSWTTSSPTSYLCLQWSSSIRLARKASGFEAPVRIPWQDKICYKFIVDGRWVTNDAEPTESEGGFVNNVYTAPSKPAPPTIDAPPAVLAPEAVHPEPKEVPSEEPAPEKSQNGIAGSIGSTVSNLADQLHSAVVAPAVAFASTLDAPYDAPTPAADESAPTLVEEVKSAVAPVAEFVGVKAVPEAAESKPAEPVDQVVSRDLISNPDPALSS